MTSITNEGENTLSNSFNAILPKCDRIDALVGYFYFSGFKDLVDTLRNVKVRILVGMDIDSRIPAAMAAQRSLNFDTKLVEPNIMSRSGTREAYIEQAATFFNETNYFDDEKSQEAFKIFLEKIKEGTLEIKKTIEPQHGKFFVLHYKPEHVTQGISHGITIEGSSNLTYSGLRGQGEHNRPLLEKHYFDENASRFEELWNNSDNIILADIKNADEFTEEIKKRVWLFALPKPVDLYHRVLSEYFQVQTPESMKTASDITNGRFSTFRYQQDAVELGIDRINRFGGVIVADVVGLGKSIVASAIAHNLGLKTIIIAPPHLKEQWDDYHSDFNFNAHVYTSGKIQEALDRHEKDEDLLIVIDEAHKYKNEDTTAYQLLHRLCAGNKVMALSATPFNNDPRDIYAIVKLFTTPGQSVIKTVENLSMSFHGLFTDYKKLRRELRKNKKGEVNTAELRAKGDNIANELRRLIAPLVIRRSRLDLKQIEFYKQDLEMQGVSFAEVADPEVHNYDLGQLTNIYVETLERIAPKEMQGIVTEGGFIGARYKPAKYIIEGSKFLAQLAEDADDDGSADEKLQSLQQAQVNIAKFMRRLLVRRFESSIYSFHISLDRMIVSSQTMLDWYEKRKEVPIFKKAALPNIDDLDDMLPEEQEKLLESLEGKGLMRIPAEDMQPTFAEHLRADIALLQGIKNQWTAYDTDPKLDYFAEQIKTLLEKEPHRKVVVFSEFNDTANYVQEELKKRGFSRSFKYGAEDASRENKLIIRKNFDAGLPVDEQNNDIDIIVATDAISEGFNLHRAGIVVNYDIPYNPTRVIQRIGRINRINKKVFDKLYIWNFFPTPTGEKESDTRGIAELKMNIIHKLMGEDTKVFSGDEELQNYFAKEYREENEKFESLSWDATYRNDWLLVKDNKKIRDTIAKIPLRSRIGRNGNESFVIAFAKRGDSYVFAHGSTAEDAEVVSPELVLPLFKADAEEKPVSTTANFDAVYQRIKEHMFKDNTRATIDDGRRKNALERLQVLGEVHPQADDLTRDIIKAVKDMDALPNGLLKEIAELSLKSDALHATHEKLKELVPVSYLEDIFKTASRANNESQLVVLSEEFISL